MVHETVADIRQKYIKNPLVSVVGGNVKLSSKVLGDLGYFVRNALTPIDGVSFILGLPDWSLEVYKGIRDCTLSAIRRQNFGPQVDVDVNPDTNHSERFFVLLPSDHESSYKDKFDIYTTFKKVNTPIELAGKDKKEMIYGAAQLADLVILFGGNGVLMRYAQKLLQEGKIVAPIITSGGTSELLAKFSEGGKATPRDVADLFSYGVKLEGIERSLIRPVYNPLRLQDVLCDAFRNNIFTKINNSTTLGSGLDIQTRYNIGGESDHSKYLQNSSVAISSAVQDILDEDPLSCLDPLPIHTIPSKNGGPRLEIVNPSETSLEVALLRAINSSKDSKK
jgi:hypothetical protein